MKVKLPARTESSIGRAFVKKVKALHPSWLVIKLKGDGRRDLPDYMVLTDYGRARFLEMKRPGKELTSRQRGMVLDLQCMGFRASWADSVDDAVHEVTKELT